MKRTRHFVYDSCQQSVRVTKCVYKNETWCCVRADGQPDRWFRLHRPDAIESVLSIYGYMNGDGCVSSKQGRRETGDPLPIENDPLLDLLSNSHRRVQGVPQRVHNSGLCWYCAMCFTMLFARQMRALLVRYAPSQLVALCKDVLVSKDRAEALRHHLYNHYGLGDRPGQNPQLDGQNGFSQFSILAARLGIPLVRLFAPKMVEINDPVVDVKKGAHLLRGPTDGEPCLLVVRCFRTKWTPTPVYKYKGRKYRLVAMLIGSEHCGHQIGASTCDMDCGMWALTDSDAAQHGVGPMYWSLLRRDGERRRDYRRRWRAMWDSIIPVILFGRQQVCDLNPSNRPTHELEKYAKRMSQPAPPGVVNTDWIYLCDA